MPEPVTTLTDFFARKTCRPARFFSDLTEANVWSFSEDDRLRALEMARTADAKFTRTISLAAAALQARDDRFRRPILEFVWRSAEQRLQDNPRYIAGRDSQSADPIGRLHAVESAVAPGLHESKRRVESLNLFIAAALWLQYSEALGAQDIADEVVSVVRSLPRLRRPDDAALVGHIAERARSGTKAIVPLIALLEPWIDQAKQSARLASSETERADAATAAHTRAEDALEQAEAEITSLRESVQQSHTAAARVEEEARAERTHHEHSSSRLRSQVASSLTGRLAELLTTAREALELDEPRVHVAQEKLEIAIEEVERQAEWLRSSA